MKTILLSLVLFVVGFTAQAQSNVEPMRKANLVLVSTPDSGRVALHKLAILLTQQGYIVDKEDKELLSLITRPQTISKGSSPVLTIQATATPGALSRLTISGQYKFDAATLGEVNGIAQFTGMDGAANKVTFRAIERVVKLYPSGKLDYGVR